MQASQSLYTGKKACEMIGAPGEEIRKPTHLQQYKVFVQSTGIGHRPLQKDTEILYEVLRCTSLLLCGLYSPFQFNLPIVY